MCVFCDIVTRKAPAQIIQEWDDALAIVPLAPVVDGHTLIIPKQHVRDASDNPTVTAATMKRASEFGKNVGEHNVIINVGPIAGQTVFHLHIHIIPRAEHDGLKLPWTEQVKK